MSDLTPTPISEPFRATFTPPGSKSLTNRALILAALADGQSTLSNVLFADDTKCMTDSLTRLGHELDIDESARTIIVSGGAPKVSSAELFCGNSGTTIRFLAAALSVANGTYTLDGVERMRQRPLGQLVNLLRNLGVRVTYGGEENFPPITIHAHGLPGGLLRYGSAQSSQYLSAILMVAPYARHEVDVDLDGPQTSWPYVAMTMRLMDNFDITPELVRDPETGQPTRIVVPRGKYKAAPYHVEPDASNASYFFAAAAINPGAKITIEGLGRYSLQGDVAFADTLHKMGATLVFGKDFITLSGTDTLEGIEADMSDMPDMAQTLAVVALFASGPTTLRGLHTLRVKETDRVKALATELHKLGAEVDVEGDDLTIHPPDRFKAAHIDTYDDHRMAMSFAVATTRASGITIRNVECVNKTYPHFFEDFARVTGVSLR
jgi:3-phosphoshikimate 1-carboxyvinyltransferase